MGTTLCSSNVSGRPQVFINFRGVELRRNFVCHLYDALKRNGINAFIDSDEDAGRELQYLYRRIEESKIALAILSSKYTESRWCLNELVKMKECSTKGEGCKNLCVIPIFYKLKPSIVTSLEGTFGVNLLDVWRRGDVRDDQIVKWNDALQYAGNKMALVLEEDSEEVPADFMARIVTKVKNALDKIPENHYSQPQERGAITESHYSQPGERLLKQLEEKLDVECNGDETRIVGLVGMAGIGKTYLANNLFKKLENYIGRRVFIKFLREKSEEQTLNWLQKTIAEGLLKEDYPNLVCDDGNSLEVWKDSLTDRKLVVVFDNVRDLKHIEPLLGNRDWITKGSRIVVTTRDKSLVQKLDCDLYEVPGLNERDALELFRAQIDSKLEGNLMEMSRKFVDYCGGHPLALKAFGKELKGKEEDQWVSRIGTLTQISNVEIRNLFREIYESDLDEKQMNAFLDIVCFFRSQDENYVTSLLDPTEAGGEVRNLVDKFMIHISDGRVEMHDLLFTMGKELIETSTLEYWILSSNSAVSTNALRNKTGRDTVRGIVIDMSKMKEMVLDNKAFIGMSSLRYLKVYNSLFPSHAENECKLNLPDELLFSKDNIVRYLHWPKFPGKKLPSGFEPNNLIDLSLPYSKIISVWDCAKVAPNLKWVDLSHSGNLKSLLGLSEAPNLLRLNLEGCTSLEELHEEMKEMKKLVFMNLRGCTSLFTLPDIKMDSLKTLILSGCSKFQTFKVISEHLETLYLNGTAIKELPLAICDLRRLVLLNLKDCKNLATLPDCLGKMKSLQELKLSRCSKLDSFSMDKEVMVKLRVLLLDETSIAEMPSNMIYLSLLRRLCLSRNDTICTIQFDMGQLLHLKWLELKHCRNLTSLSRLPPNLQCLNAHGCTLLRTVTSPLARLMPTEQIQASFIFTNCHELEQISKNAIISYVQKKSQLMSHDRYNKAFLFKLLINTCFPGCEIPAWFNHQALGSVLELELPRYWNEGRLKGIALCVVVSFKEYKNQNNSLQVKCACEFTNASLNPESFIVGGWSESGDEPHTVEADHIFIGYTTLYNINKRQQFSSATEASLRFEVTNGTSEVAECKVMKCGFSLVYESDEAENATWEEISTMENSIQDQRSSFKTGGDGPSSTPTTADSKRANKTFSLFWYKNHD